MRWARALRYWPSIDVASLSISSSYMVCITRAPVVLNHSAGMPSYPAIFPLPISSIAYCTFHTSNRQLMLSSSRRRSGSAQPSSWSASSRRCRSLLTLLFRGLLIYNIFPSPRKTRAPPSGYLYYSVPSLHFLDIAIHTCLVHVFEERP